MMKFLQNVFLVAMLFSLTGISFAKTDIAAPVLEEAIESHAIFDDAKLLEGFYSKYKAKDFDILMQMLLDEGLTSYKLAAVVKVIRVHHYNQLALIDKREIEKIFLKRLSQSKSPFVQVEIMNALVALDRLEYFKSMVPTLIQKLDHYNETVNLIAYDYLNEIVESDRSRPREAEVVFDTLRKVLFLSKKKLEEITQPNERLTKKLTLLRWSIKKLGVEKLDKLPKEVIKLL